MTRLQALSLLAFAGAGVIVQAFPLHHDSPSDSSSHKESKRELPMPMTPANPSDLAILNFALTLEHMESAFYTSGLSQYTPTSFTNTTPSGTVPASTYAYFQQISQHEQSHVQFLQSLIGPNAVAPCTYSFPYTNPNEFITMSGIFESVGAAAYLGATNLFVDPYLMTATGAIMTTEARQATWINSLNINNSSNPWSSSFETPLSANQVASLASSFITSCPSTNPPLIAQPFPIMNVTTSNPQPGGVINVVYDTTPSNVAIGGAGSMSPIGGYNTSNPSAGGQQQIDYLALLSGLNTWFVPITNTGAPPPPNSTTTTGTTTIANPYLSAPQQLTSGTALLPQGLQGTVYALITSSNTSIADNTTIAGVAMLNFPFAATANNTGGAPVPNPVPVSNSTSATSTASYSYSTTYSSTIVSQPISSIPLPVSAAPVTSSLSSLPFVVSTLALPPPEITTILTYSY